MKLYHGSSINIEKTLKPHRAFDRLDYTPQVYLTDKIELALLYAINPISVYIKNTFGKEIQCSAISAHLWDKESPSTLIEMYPNMFEKTYLHRKAYLYVCEIDNDKVNDEGSNHYTINQEIDFVEKIEIDNVYGEILNLQAQGKLKLLQFENIGFVESYFERDHLIGCLSTRKEYCKSSEEKSFFEMMGKYFPLDS